VSTVKYLLFYASVAGTSALESVTE